MQAIEQQNLDFLWQDSTDSNQMPYAIVRIGSALSDEYSGEGDSFLLVTKKLVVRCDVYYSADDFEIVKDCIKQNNANYVLVERTSLEGINHDYVLTKESCNGSVGKVHWSAHNYLNGEDKGIELHIWEEMGCCPDMPYLALKSRAKKMAAQAKYAAAAK